MKAIFKNLFPKFVHNVPFCRAHYIMCSDIPVSSLCVPLTVF